jgi:DNA sulfur modification protein DndD
MEKEIITLTGKIQPKSQTIAHSKCEKKIEVLSNLIEVWEAVTTHHRETMRDRVEKNASDLFMSLTNKKQTYRGLKIHTNFQVEILHKKKSRGAEAGSGGQSALMAYSILDALTKSSGIEFPMVVDTPARSIDKNNLSRLFDYLLLESKKQVIILPESKELEPEEGDEKYGGRCVTTYEIELIGKDEDLSKLKLRINNTGKTNKEMGYDD